MKKALATLLCVTVILAVVTWARRAWLAAQVSEPPSLPLDPAFLRLTPEQIASLPEASRWAVPMGSEHGALTYNAQPFRVTRHLGDDLNGIGGYNSDLGDSVYAAATGVVVYRGIPGPGWGNMIILAHRVPNAATDHDEVYQSLYAHLDSSLVQPGQLITRGQKIATVGTAFGKYLAHLHFEVRHGPYVNPGIGYADTGLNCVSPERFIAEHGGGPEAVLYAVPRLTPP